MALPDWLDPLYEAAEMRAVDEWAIEEQGVPSLDLMERAGIGLARIVAERARPGAVRVVIGKGDNGGDRLVGGGGGGGGGRGGGSVAGGGPGGGAPRRRRPGRADGRREDDPRAAPGRRPRAVRPRPARGLGRN